MGRRVLYFLPHGFGGPSGFRRWRWQPSPLLGLLVRVFAFTHIFDIHVGTVPAQRVPSRRPGFSCRTFGVFFFLGYAPALLLPSMHRVVSGWSGYVWKTMSWSVMCNCYVAFPLECASRRGFVLAFVGVYGTFPAHFMYLKYYFPAHNSETMVMRVVGVCGLWRCDDPSARHALHTPFPARSLPANLAPVLVGVYFF